MIFLHPNSTPPTTPPVLGLYPLTVSAPRPHTKQYVHQETYTADLIDHSPAVKLYVEDQNCPVTVLLTIAIQCFAQFTCFQILREIWSFDSQKNL